MAMAKGTSTGPGGATAWPRNAALILRTPAFKELLTELSVGLLRFGP